MRTLPVILTIFGLFFLHSTQAQHTGLTCGSGDIHSKLLEENPLYSRSIFALEQRMLELQEEAAQRGGDEIYSIPVVVHVIHEGEDVGQGSNISDEQVVSSIDALNEDFRKITGSNGDGEGVDCHIEFCLAKRDPNGNSTNGIIRVNGTGVADYAEMGIEATGSSGAPESEVKALSTWPREDYMNIWVVNEIEDNDANSGIQGYAYFPFNSPLDGIVVLYNAIGTVGNLKPNTNMNRTVSHEVGHYFALYHTFHNTSNCDSETSCATQGDKVCDTPPTPLAVSCANPGCSGTQQVENYMDYTAESCRNMFSDGQRTRMRATIEGDRSTLLSSLGCIPVTTNDAAITEIISPSGANCSTVLEPEVRITNYGSAPLTSVEVDYGIDALDGASYSWTGNIASGLSATVILPSIISPSGSHSLVASVHSPNGADDEYDTNNENSSDFVISTGASLMLEVTLDYFGSETTWEILDIDNAVMASGGPYINNNQGLVMTESICVPDGCYTLWFYDDYGDGMGFTSGGFTLHDGDYNELVNDGGNFGQEVAHDFCVESPTGNAPEAAFSVSSTTGCPSTTFDFTDLSAQSPSSWSWVFEGGVPATSTVQHPQNVTFNGNGPHTVSLTVGSSFGSSSITQTDLIDIGSGPSFSMIVQDITCSGLSDGGASIEVNGNGTYTYDWSTGSTQSSVSGLNSGTYTVDVMDANGCGSSGSFTLDNPSPVSATVFKSDISCNGETDGSAIVSASGGHGGFSYQWSTGGTTSSLVGLAMGSYNVTVTDNSGCADSESFTIVEPSALTLTALLLNPESCVGNDGSAAANAMGGTPSYNIMWSNGQSTTELSGVSAGFYSVTVTDGGGCSTQNTVEVPFECIGAPESTQLIDTDCNATNLSMSDEIHCDPIAGAEMYQWKFENAAAGLFREEYTAGNNPSFELSQVIDLTYGMTLNISVRVMSNEQWSGYGTACTITMQDDVPSTSLTIADCGLIDVRYLDVIHCQEVTAANTYEWKFTDANALEIILLSYAPELMITEGSGIELGISYEVEVRAIVGDLYGSWGESCNITMDESVSVFELDNSAASAMFYPNPGTGENLFIEMWNLSESTTVIELRVYSVAGQLIENMILSNSGSSHLRTVHEFGQILTPGMYFIQYTLEGRKKEEKLIIK
jgi:PKD repeat protein